MNNVTPSSKKRPKDYASEQISRSASVELVLAGALWGFGFIATVWALKVMGPLMVISLRFLIATVIGGIVIILIPRLREQASRQQFWLAAVPGFLLMLTLVLQTWGLQYTTATKSGFITTLYVLMVPFLERFWLKLKLPRFHMIYVGIGLVGVALICDFNSVIRSVIWGSSDAISTAISTPNETLDVNSKIAQQSWNFGDLLTFACAIAASFQIVWFAWIHDRIKSPFVFNIYQSIWATIIPLAFALLIEPWPDFTRLLGTSGSGLVSRPLIGLLMLAIGSTLIAFALQVKAQKSISPSMASLLFLLESPFATLFAIYFLSESLKTDQWVGAGLILAAAFLCSAFGRAKENMSGCAA